VAGTFVASGGIALAQEPTDAAFRKWCLPCHDAGPDAKIKLGPPLNGLDGRAAGTFPGFNYSDANKNSGITWNKEQFLDYIKDPKAKIPGTKMAIAGIKNENEANNLWAYISKFDKDGKTK